MKKPKIYWMFNDENKKNFEKHKFDGTIKYTCLFCKEKKDIFNVVSDNGNRMICTLCAKKYYGSPYVAVNTFCLNRKLRDKDIIRKR